MPRIIEDAFTHLDISRQRRYQLRMESAGRCRICGEKTGEGSPYCEKHRKAQTGYDQERRGPAVRPMAQADKQMPLFQESDADKI
jgi:hypothetical protein